MIRKSKLALIAAIVAVGIAAPALAQSFDPDAGTSNLVGVVKAAPTTSQGIVAAPAGGLHAYGTVPLTATAPAGAAAAATDPSDNGGGSTGYNEMLLQY
jgi:hypothetical protein